MTKKRFQQLLLVCTGVVGAIAYFGFGSAQCRINCWSVARIQLGMSEAEVDAIIGVPHGDYVTNAAEIAPGFKSQEINGRGWFGVAQMKAWRSDHGVIRIHFDGDGRVVLKRFEPCSRSASAWLECWLCGMQ